MESAILNLMYYSVISFLRNVLHRWSTERSILQKFFLFSIFFVIVVLFPLLGPKACIWLFKVCGNYLVVVYKKYLRLQHINIPVCSRLCVGLYESILAFDNPDLFTRDALISILLSVRPNCRHSGFTILTGHGCRSQPTD